VISKVALSICALLVVSVLGSAFGQDIFLKDQDELSRILTDLADTIERRAWSTCESTVTWSLPFLVDGSRVELEVSSSGLIARSGGRACAVELSCGVHTWHWNGSALNETIVEALDASSPGIRSVSGQTLEVETKAVCYENRSTMFAFVRSSPSGPS